MEYATLNNGVKMPMVGLGTFPLVGNKLIETVKMAKELGYELFDTAGAYDNETDLCIGLELNKKSEQLNKTFISSKVNWLQLRGRLRYLFLNRETIKSAYKHSCKRLGVDKLDLFLLHQPFDGFCEAYKEMINLYEQGKVRAIGVCNFDNDELKKLYASCGQYPMINQTEISPRNSFKDIIHFCQDNGIQVEAYSPFGRGNLVEELMNDKELLEIGKNHNKTVGQIVLRWIVQQNIIVIPRSTNYDRLKQNLDIFDFELTNEEMNIIDNMNQNRVFGVNQVNKYKVNKY